MATFPDCARKLAVAATSCSVWSMRSKTSAAASQACARSRWYATAQGRCAVHPAKMQTLCAESPYTQRWHTVAAHGATTLAALSTSCTEPFAGIAYLIPSSSTM
eukprot:1653551-Rhodomonas_salina.1